MSSTTSIDLAALLGGEDAEALHRDGRRESVRIACLPVRLYPKYTELQADEAAQLELVCSRPAGWADTLTIESHEALLARAHQLNFPAASRWFDRQVASVTRLASAAKTPAPAA